MQLRKPLNRASSSSSLVLRARPPPRGGRRQIGWGLASQCTPSCFGDVTTTAMDIALVTRTRARERERDDDFSDDVHLDVVVFGDASRDDVVDVARTRAPLVAGGCCAERRCGARRGVVLARESRASDDAHGEDDDACGERWERVGVGVGTRGEGCQGGRG